MGRRRKHNKHLPRGMLMSRGKYYRKVTENGRQRWIPLGADLGEALRAYPASEARTHTVDDLLGAYLTARANRAPKTLEGYRAQAERLGKVFGSVQLAGVRRAHIAKYMQMRGGVIANRERDLFRAAWNWALNVGVTEVANPMAEMRFRNPEARRRRYVTDAELAALERASGPRFAPLLRWLYLTGMRLGDALGMPLSAGGKQGVTWVTGKTQRAQSVAWSAALRKTWEAAAGERKVGPLFVSRLGTAYTVTGVESIFQHVRVRARVPDVRLHDLRRKAASDVSLEHASALLGHADSRVTATRYRAKVEAVKPVR